jgi:iron-sulfur cluster repair protein YtfE (RIC family)
MTAVLTAEHRRLEAQLAELARLLVAGVSAEAQALFEGLDHDMRRHVHSEEELLFPIFEARVGIAGPVAVMRREHRTIEALLEAAAVALDRADAAAAMERLRRLAVLLADHHVKEERILYPKTEQVLSASEWTELTAQLQRA